MHCFSVKAYCCCHHITNNEKQSWSLLGDKGFWIGFKSRRGSGIYSTHKGACHGGPFHIWQSQLCFVSLVILQNNWSVIIFLFFSAIFWQHLSSLRVSAVTHCCSLNHTPTHTHYACVILKETTIALPELPLVSLKLWTIQKYFHTRNKPDDDQIWSRLKMRVISRLVD